MAGFTKKQLENLKLEPDNLASIKDAVQETFYNDEDFSSFVNIMKVKNDDPIALIGEMEMVGKKGGAVATLPTKRRVSPTLRSVGNSDSGRFLSRFATRH